MIWKYSFFCLFFFFYWSILKSLEATTEIAKLPHQFLKLSSTENWSFSLGSLISRITCQLPQSFIKGLLGKDFPAVNCVATASQVDTPNYYFFHVVETYKVNVTRFIWLCNGCCERTWWSPQHVRIQHRSHLSWKPSGTKYLAAVGLSFLPQHNSQ